MERLYNPDSMSADEIKSTFVARQPLLDRLITLIRHQPEGAGVQHVVLIAPRGMGKTTLLLMLQFAVAEEGLAPPWLALRFPEELYGVNDLADFWLEVLDGLARETDDPALGPQMESLKEQYPDSARLQDAALALIKDWCRQHARRLVLLVDNLNLILGLTNEQEEASLRRVLMNEGFLMVVGAAPSFFREATDYQLPLYQFFKTEQLRELTFPEIQDLLRCRAAADGLPDFENTLRENAPRLRVLEYFTGGNPRLVLMLYRVVTQSDVHDVRIGLELLLDQATPYYKAKTESLPPQQRKILDQIARVTGQTHEGVTPKDIGAAIRLSPQTVSAQLKRLTESGYVRPADLRGRNAFYTLSEPLYALWYQMRFGRDGRQKMQWLVTFLKGWYDARGLREEDRRLEERFRKQFDAGFVREARETLENRRYLTEAADEGPQRIGMLARLIASYLQLKDTAALKEDVLSGLDPQSLPAETLTALVLAGSLDRGDSSFRDAAKKSKMAAAILQEGVEELRSRHFQVFLEKTKAAVDMLPTSIHCWDFYAIALRLLHRYEEALISINNALDLDPNNPQVLQERGAILLGLERSQEAFTDLEQSLALDAQQSQTWYVYGRVLAAMGQYDKALISLERAVAINSQYSGSWFEKGNVLKAIGRPDEAIEDYKQAIALYPNDLRYVSSLFSELSAVGRYNEALSHYPQLLQLAEQQGLPDEIMVTVRNLPSLIDQTQDLKRRGKVYEPLLQFLRNVQQSDFVAARQNWMEAVSAGKDAGMLQEHLYTRLTTVAGAGFHEFARELIAESGLDQEYFPLARALDYLMTGDDALVEKLSPEMRPIVDKLVTDLRPESGEVVPDSGETSPKPRKTTSTRRAAKQRH